MSPPIRSVHLWTNGLTMVFDAFGQQMPEHQGPWLTHLPAILAAADGDTRWTIGSWRRGAIDIERAEVECLLDQLTRSLTERSAAS